MGARPGEQAPWAKLTWQQVRLIRMVWDAGGVTMEQLARLMGVAKQTVEKIVYRETWKEPPG